VIGPEQIRGELGDLLLGRVTGRTSPGEVTLFRSMGLAIEDMVAAQYVLDQAMKAGVGTRVEF
jgi:ornithine cyclodeaminase